MIVSWSLRDGLVQPGDLDHDAQAESVQSKRAIGLLLGTKLQAEPSHARSVVDPLDLGPDGSMATPYTGLRCSYTE